MYPVPKKGTSEKRPYSFIKIRIKEILLKLVNDTITIN